MTWARACMWILLGNLGACAQVPTNPDERAEFQRINDPLEPMNRAIFRFNTVLDDYITAPLARGYRDVAPEGFQRGLHNVLKNLGEPYVAGNELLQGRVHDAADDLGRFMVNSTFGLGGVFDVASQDGRGPQPHDSDLGATLGVWGVGEGPYLVLPFFGPSNPRDAAGLAAGFWADPVDAVFDSYDLDWLSQTQFGTGIVDTRTQLLDPLDDLRSSSLDYYGSLRSLYRQKRHALLQSDEASTANLPPAPGD